jgi:serine/threonine-protein kinase
MDLAEALPVLTAIADVLSAVHAAGMAHRDLKPGNVMLCPGFRTVLLDFGIVLPEVSAADMARCGTPRYLAPEVISGRVAPGRAHLVDTYAFGTVAYETLAGRPPFDASSTVELLEKHLRAVPTDLAELRRDVPPRLVSLIMSCLAKDPSERPEDMEAVSWELRSHQRRQVEGSGPVRVRPGAVRETYRMEILIVEDDEDIREGLATVLNARGCRTVVAADGREALELMRTKGWRPSLILLDLMMPVMDGRGFLESQVGDPCLDGIPVVLVTAQQADEARRFPSVRGVVPKPLEMPALLDLIQEVAGARRR